MEVSNYIKMRDQMQERFLTYDQKEIEGKYGFAFDDDYFYVPASTISFFPQQSRSKIVSVSLKLPWCT